MKTILHTVLYPQRWIYEQQLYIRYNGTGMHYDEHELRMDPCVIVDFGTYFNSFSFGKWKKYTILQDLFLVLKLQGRGRICVYRYCLDGGTVKQTDLCESFFEHVQMKEICIDLSQYLMQQDAKGMIGFSLQADDEGIVLKEASFCSENSAEPTDIQLALAFTTYKREEDITSNIDRILELNDERISIYVADNAGSLSQRWSSERVHIVSNINSGGAGGFGRCMLEIMKEKNTYTHAILMDDDVTIDPRIFEWLIVFLSMLREECKNAMIGGAMLRRDYPYCLVESGAERKGIVVEGYGDGLDLRRKDAILHADTEHKADYNAWWFCCIPICYIRDGNLPLPLFFQWDDVDYGVRNQAPLILLNGIALWHEPFDVKRSAMHTYYSTRNPLIVNGCHPKAESLRKILKSLKQKVISEICLYRYEQAEALIMAMEDYLKGPEWLCTIRPDEYNEQIRKLNYFVSYVADQVDFEWYLVGCGITDCDLLHALIRKLTMNGYLLSADRELILPLYADRPVQGYRAKKITFYEVNTGTGYVAERDRKRALQCLMRFQRAYWKMFYGYAKVAKAYKDAYAYMTSKEMWVKYLRLGD